MPANACVPKNVLEQLAQVAESNSQITSNTPGVIEVGGVVLTAC